MLYKLYLPGSGAVKALLFVVAGLVVNIAKAQPEIGAALKARATGFYGTFGQTYSALGYEPSVTFKPTSKPWAGGLSYSKNMLGYDAASDLEVGMNLVTVHAGAKKSVGKYVHPFAYMLLGLRFMNYENAADATTEDEPLFTSFSLGYGARTGLQIGRGNWRFEGSIEYTTGTKARYLTPASFRRAADSGKEYRDFTSRSPISSVSAGVGVAYVFGLGSSG